LEAKVINSLLYIVGFFLIVVSIIDIKWQEVPSIFLTGMLFVVVFVTAFANPMALTFGILGFIVSYLLYEAGFFSGVADIKIFTMISFMVLNAFSFFLFLILVCVLGIVWKTMIRIGTHKTKKESFAFIPVFTFCYALLWVFGGLT
jgi:hypothetical protein